MLHALMNKNSFGVSAQRAEIHQPKATLWAVWELLQQLRMTFYAGADGLNFACFKAQIWLRFASVSCAGRMMSFQ